MPFLGYGNAAAQLWIVGQEDSGDEIRDWSNHGTRSLTQSLRTRAGWRLSRDLDRARSDLECPREPRGGGPWAFAERLILKSTGHEVTGDAEKDAAAARFGHGHGPSLLADLYPLPLRRGKFKGAYGKCGLWRSESQYRKEIGPLRAAKFVRLLRHRSRVRCVVAYCRGADLLLEAWGESRRVLDFTGGNRRVHWHELRDGSRRILFVATPFWGQGRFSLSELDQVADRLRAYLE
jgi:hypothetical protein